MLGIIETIQCKNCDAYMVPFQAHCGFCRFPNDDFVIQLKFSLHNHGIYKYPNHEECALCIKMINGSKTIDYNGETASQASRRLGGSSHLVSTRLDRGWSMDDAFTTPVDNDKYEKLVKNHV